mmetsp:Transcript_16395/g.46926  ORF Transcript_16395/g.46926 Transcript_16395/m.46926 type:complete len:330 (-) Transcript_16395:2-991(-)
MRLDDAERALQLQCALGEEALELPLRGLQGRARVHGVAGAVGAPDGPQRAGRAVLADAGVRGAAHEERLAHGPGALDAHGEGAGLLEQDAHGALGVVAQVLAECLRLGVLKHDRLLPDNEEPGHRDLRLDLPLQGLAVDLPLLKAVRLDQHQGPLHGQRVEVGEEELDVPHGLPRARAAVAAEVVVRRLELLRGEGVDQVDDVLVEVLDDQNLRQTSRERLDGRLALHLRQVVEEAVSILGGDVDLLPRLHLDVRLLELLGDVLALPRQHQVRRQQHQGPRLLFEGEHGAPCCVSGAKGAALRLVGLASRGRSRVPASSHGASGLRGWP